MWSEKCYQINLPRSLFFSVTNFVLRCRRVFHTMITYSINELCNAADALIAPVRLGIVKPTAFVCQSENSDCLHVSFWYFWKSKRLEFHLLQSTTLCSVAHRLVFCLCHIGWNLGSEYFVSFFKSSYRWRRRQIAEFILYHFFNFSILFCLELRCSKLRFFFF